ncbi:MAG: aminotransferase class III-fold pyridoxal phosphate-dependent enzyme [Synergistaceae bacterium]|nr:aminotransferase class III-fold pyridoxal phosphate-dependent enzyme [Synergistaceae bacterium]
MPVFPRNFQRKFPKITHGDGIYLIDDKGNRYLDGCSGAVSANIGYGNQEIAKAIYDQLCKVSFAHGSIWETEINELAAQKILGIAPKGFNYVWYVNAGSEATEAAIKMARQYFLERDGVSEKHLVIGRNNGYHGSTLGTLGIGGNVNRRKLFMTMIKDHPKVETHYCYRCPFNKQYPGCNLECARSLEENINRIGAQYVSSFIAEPIIGSTAGAVVAPPEYWGIVREICNRYDILLIADEVMTGVGRTGKNYCVEHWGITPDIIASAKGLASCYFPAGATIVTQKVADAFANGSGVFAHSHTFNGMPAASAAINAVLDFYIKNHLCDNAAEMGKIMEKYSQQILSCEYVGDVRGKGLMWGFEFVKDKATKEPFTRNEGVGMKFRDFCLQRGFTVYPGASMVDGVNGDNIIIAPPLIITEQKLIELLDMLVDALNAFAKELY